MTQEERIANLEKQVLSLKKELKSKRKANVWKNVRNKFQEDLNSFDWTHIHNTTSCDGEPLEFQTRMNESDKISTAIATIVRVSLKRKGINCLEEQDEERAANITKQILEIMKNERREHK